MNTWTLREIGEGAAISADESNHYGMTGYLPVAAGVQVDGQERSSRVSDSVCHSIGDVAAWFRSFPRGERFNPLAVDHRVHFAGRASVSRQTTGLSHGT